MANKHRGEVEVTIGGVVYTLRPTFEALVEFEDKTGSTAYEALKNVLTRNAAPFKQIATLFQVCIKAAWPVEGKRAPSYSEIGQSIMKEGLSNFIVPFMTVLNNALTSEADLQMAEERESKGKADSVQETPTQA